MPFTSRTLTPRFGGVPARVVTKRISKFELLPVQTMHARVLMVVVRQTRDARHFRDGFESLSSGRAIAVVPSLLRGSQARNPAARAGTRGRGSPPCKSRCATRDTTRALGIGQLVMREGSSALTAQAAGDVGALS